MIKKGVRQLESQNKIKKPRRIRDISPLDSICNEDCVASGACFHRRKSTSLFPDKTKFALRQEFMRAPVAYVLGLKESRRRTLGFLLANYFIKRQQKQYHANQLVAYSLNCSRKTVNQSLGDLTRLGFISKVGQQKRSDTCSYELDEFLTTRSMRKLLAVIFPFLWTTVVLAGTPNFVEETISKPEVTQYKESFFVSQKKTLINNSVTVFFIKKEEGVSMASDIDMSPAARAITSLRLSTTGMIKLSAFPERAIMYADRMLAKALQSKAVADPFGYLCKVATAYCKQQKKVPNWRLVNDLMQRHGVHEGMPKYEEVLLTVQEKTVTNGANNRANDWRVKQREHDDMVSAENAADELMSYEERKNKMRPKAAEWSRMRKSNPSLFELMMQKHPWADGQRIVNELCDEYEGKIAPKRISDQEAMWNSMSHEERCATWESIIPALRPYTPEQRAKMLRSKNLDYVIPFVESLI